MSSYRDDHNAARLRIETLEAKLRERDAALSAREIELAEREAEIARLKQEASSDRASTPPSVAEPRKAIAAMMAIGFSVLFLSGVGGYLRMGRHSRCGFDRQRWHGPPPSPMVIADPAAVPRRAAPDAAELAARLANAPETVAPDDINEKKIRAVLEPKVASGKASVDEISLLKAMCSYMGDKACRDRAMTALKLAKQREADAQDDAL